MGKPIGMFRFQNTSRIAIGVEVSDISVIEKRDGTDCRSRIVMKNGTERLSPESHSLLMDRYDEMLRMHRV